MEHKFATSVTINNDLPLSVIFLDLKDAFLVNLCITPPNQIPSGTEIQYIYWSYS